MSYRQSMTAPNLDMSSVNAASSAFGSDGSVHPNLENHLLFIRKHRGDFSKTGNGVFITSEVSGFTSWIPTAEDQELPPGFQAIRLYPGMAQHWLKRLGEAGFEPAETLSYQYRAVSEGPTFSEIDERIRRVSSETEALAFASVQEAAFLSQADPNREFWQRHFELAALRNFHDPDEDMLIAWVDDRAAAVLLIVHSKEVAGLYAVATRPEFERNGLSCALLDHAMLIAEARGAQSLVLQAMQGSYADGFYRRQGFEEQFTSTVWRRTMPKSSD